MKRFGADIKVVALHDSGGGDALVRGRCSSACARTTFDGAQGQSVVIHSEKVLYSFYARTTVWWLLEANYSSSRYGYKNALNRRLAAV